MSHPRQPSSAAARFSSSAARCADSARRRAPPEHTQSGPRCTVTKARDSDAGPPCTKPRATRPAATIATDPRSCPLEPSCADPGRRFAPRGSAGVRVWEAPDCGGCSRSCATDREPIVERTVSICRSHRFDFTERVSGRTQPLAHRSAKSLPGVRQLSPLLASRIRGSSLPLDPFCAAMLRRRPNRFGWCTGFGPCAEGLPHRVAPQGSPGASDLGPRSSENLLVRREGAPDRNVRRGLATRARYRAPIAARARPTSSTPSGGSADCGGSGAPTA